MAESPRLTELGGTVSVQAATVAIGATTSDEVAVWTNNTGQKVRVTGFGFLPETAVTGAATNNMALQARNKGTAGTGTTGITAVKTYASGVDIAAFVEDALVLATTLTDRDVDINETVALDKTENGTGLALPAGIATITYQYI